MHRLWIACGLLWALAGCGNDDTGPGLHDDGGADADAGGEGGADADRDGRADADGDEDADAEGGAEPDADDGIEVPTDAAGETGGDAHGETGDCTIGEECAEDCMPPDGPCMACGTRYNDSECRCRPIPDHGFCYWPDCTAAGPAEEGEYCGSWWWCDRDCAAGLECRAIPPAEDPTPGDGASALRTCQP